MQKRKKVYLLTTLRDDGGDRFLCAPNRAEAWRQAEDYARHRLSTRRWRSPCIVYLYVLVPGLAGPDITKGTCVGPVVEARYCGKRRVTA